MLSSVGWIKWVGWARWIVGFGVIVRIGVIRFRVAIMSDFVIILNVMARS